MRRIVFLLMFLGLTGCTGSDRDPLASGGGPSTPAGGAELSQRLALFGRDLPPVARWIGDDYLRPDEIPTTLPGAAPTLELSRLLRDGFTLNDKRSSVSVRVRLRGAGDVRATVEGGWVRFANALDHRHDVVQRIVPDGTEDLVLLDAPRSELVYDLTLGDAVGGLRLVENVLEIVDVQGTPRLRMAAPYLIGANRVRHDAQVRIMGCEVDTDPSGPWGRAPKAPGSRECAVQITWDAARVTHPALVDPTWTTTASMATARDQHTATTLKTGTIFVTGGGSSTAELFDPSTSTWSTTGSMSAARVYYSVNVLASGRVLVAGGMVTGTVVSTSELYDPGGGGWKATGNMTQARRVHTGVTVPSGKVFVAGGQSDIAPTTALSSAELYDATSGVWTATFGMAQARYQHTATLLASGLVLVAGGEDPTGGPTASAATYDPVADSWSLVGSLTTARYAHAAERAGTNVLVAGGWNGSTVYSSVERFDASTGKWTAMPGMTAPRRCTTLSVLPSGNLLVAGGYSLSGVPTAGTLSSAEIFDIASATWTPTANMGSLRACHTASLLPSGKVLVAGGRDTLTYSSAELFALAVIGGTCGTGAECASGVCVAGTCAAGDAGTDASSDGSSDGGSDAIVDATTSDAGADVTTDAGGETATDAASESGADSATPPSDSTESSSGCGCRLTPEEWDTPNAAVLTGCFAVLAFCRRRRRPWPL